MTSYCISPETAPRSSDQGLPLANGLMGATIWADADDLIVSLDRSDLWDLRPVPEYRGPGYSYADTIALHRAGRHEELQARLEDPYKHPGPTKLPAGRIRICGESWSSGRVDVATATAEVACASGVRVQALVSRSDDCGHLSWADGDLSLRLEAPAFGAKPQANEPPGKLTLSHADVFDLGYPPPVIDRGPCHEAFLQTGVDGFRFAIVLGWRAGRAAWAIATSAESDDPLATAHRRVADVISRDFTEIERDHRQRWRELWSRSAVALPEPEIDRRYHLDMYKLLSAGRRGAPPIALQGPWTTDNGRLPPWKGDYHHDLNTQMTYWPVYKGNHLELGLGFLDWLWDTRVECREWTESYFGLPGLNVPMTSDLRNRQIGGWRQYTHLASTAAWLAQHFDLHWRYSGDAAFLAERAYPYLAEVCTFVEAVTDARDEAGFRTLALSASPEFNDNRPEAWFDTLTTFENSLFVWVLRRAAVMATQLGRNGEAARWSGAADEFPPLPTGGEGLLVAEAIPPDGAHRHLSHLVAIFPLDLLDAQHNASLIQRSLATLARASGELWMGYTFAWAAALHARGGDGDRALACLRTYGDHCFPNSFHANGDWQAKGHTKAVFGAFTLEGNCGAAAAVQEMLLRSGPETLSLFPALPRDWSDVRFDGLLADGGIVVGAKLTAGAVVAIQLLSPLDATVQVAGPGLRLRPVELRAGVPWRLT